MKRIILIVIKSNDDEITIVTKENETIDECLNRRCPDYKAYLIV